MRPTCRWQPTSPARRRADPSGIPGLSARCAGAEQHCYCAEITPDASLPAGLIAEGLRQLYGQLASRCSHSRAVSADRLGIGRTSCGTCGAPTETMAQSGKHCPACGLMSYPRLSPAIIIAVVRETPQGKRLLTARNHRFPAGRYSVIVGYVEPGESLEECAQREVLEEVGIRIKNIRYFGASPGRSQIR